MNVILVTWEPGKVLLKMNVVFGSFATNSGTIKK